MGGVPLPTTWGIPGQGLRLRAGWAAQGGISAGHPQAQAGGAGRMSLLFPIMEESRLHGDPAGTGRPLSGGGGRSPGCPPRGGHGAGPGVAASARGGGSSSGDPGGAAPPHVGRGAGGGPGLSLTRVVTHGVPLGRGWAGDTGGTRCALCECSPAPQPGDGDAARAVGRGWRQGCGMQAGMETGMQAGMWSRDGDRDAGCAMRDAGRDVGQGCGAAIRDAGTAGDRAGDSEAGAPGTSTRGRA